MHAGQRFAAILARRLFAPDGTKITRKQCALFGAEVFAVWNLLIAAISLIGHFATEAPRPETVPIRETYGWWLSYWIVSFLPPIAAFGAFGGLVRYQMKKGTALEQAGGGGAFHVAYALPSVYLMFPFIVVALPALLLVGAAIRKDLWGGGNSGWIPITWALLAVATVAFASTCGLGRNEFTVWLLVAIPPADFAVSWIIFAWNDQQRLAAPAETAIPIRFSLGALVAAVVLLGAYLSILVLVLR